MMKQELITQGGVEILPPSSIQTILLDFDGELTSYDGELLSIEEVEVKDPGLTQERIATIVAQLNAAFVAQHVLFTADPAEAKAAGEYSTIYVGKTEAFAPYGNFAGVAETIDRGNANKTDKAFVLLDKGSTDEHIIDAISHETNHIVFGYIHSGDGLSQYAITSTIAAGETVYGGTYSSGRNESVARVYGTLNDAKANSNGRIYVYEGGCVSNTDVGNGGTLYVSGGVAIKTSIHGTGNNHVDAARIYVYDNGKIVSTTIQDPDVYIFNGGFAENTVVSGGATWIYGDGTYFNGGRLRIFTGGSARGVVLRGIEHEGTIRSAVLSVNGGTASDVVVSKGCSVSISDSGSVHNVTLHTSATMTNVGTNAGDAALTLGKVTAEGIACSVTGAKIQGTMVVAAEGSVSDIEFVNGGNLIVSSGGFAGNITCGSINIAGTGSDLSARSIVVSSGGFANRLSFAGGSLKVLSGGLAGDFTLTSDESVSLNEGSTVENVTLNTGATLAAFTQMGATPAIISRIMDGAITGTATGLDFTGTVTVDAGKVNNTTIRQGASLIINAGTLAGATIVTGSILCEEYAYADGTITIDIADRMSHKNDRAYIINLAGLQGGDYGISISTEDISQYSSFLLANNAQGFEDEISLTINGEFAGALSTTSPLAFSDNYYTLRTNSDNDLYLCIEDVPLPDLVVSEAGCFDALDLDSPENDFTTGENIVLVYKVKNIGLLEANSFDYQLKLGENVLKTGTITGLDVAEECSISISLNADSLINNSPAWGYAHENLRFVIDPEERLEELDEDNNTATQEISISYADELPDAVYEYIARDVAYDLTLSKGSVVAHETAIAGVKYYFKVDEEFHTVDGFDAYGLVQTDGAGNVLKNGNAILACRGTEPTSQEYFLDVISDANPSGIGDNQYTSGILSVNSWLNKFENTGFRINFTGHSLGGALAQMFASQSTVKSSKLVTFNSPGMGFGFPDTSLAEYVHHYVNSGDMVSMAGMKFTDGEYSLLQNTYNCGKSYVDALTYLFMAQHCNTRFFSDDTGGLNNDIVALAAGQDSSLLSSGDFSYLASPEKFNAEYAKAILRVSCGQLWLANLMTKRSSVEGVRTLLGTLLKIAAFTPVGIKTTAFVVSLLTGWNLGLHLRDMTVSQINRDADEFDSSVIYTVKNANSIAVLDHDLSGNGTMRALDLDIDKIPDMIFDFQDLRFIPIHNPINKKTYYYTDGGSQIHVSVQTRPAGWNCITIDIGEAWYVTDIIDSHGDSVSPQNWGLSRDETKVYIISDDLDSEYFISVQRHSGVSHETGAITADTCDISSDTSSIEASVFDIDANLTAGGNNDTISVKIRNGDDEFCATLHETDLEGHFSGNISLDRTNGFVVNPDHPVTLVYEDRINSFGRPQVIEHRFNVVSVDAVIDLTAALPTDYSSTYQNLDWTVFTVAVSADSPFGQYLVVNDAPAYDRTFQVFNVSDYSAFELAVGESKITEYGKYSLSRSGSDVFFTIEDSTGLWDASADTTSPAAPNIADVEAFDVTASGGKAVSVSADFPDDAVVNEYSTDFDQDYVYENGRIVLRETGTWQEYSDPVRLEHNATVYFRSTDAAGNVSAVTSYTVTDIDDILSSRPTASADVTNLTNGNVTVSATFGDDAVQKLYRCTGQNWLTYTQPVVMTDNGTVFFCTIDAAGNVSEVTSYAVTNIDKVAPAKPVAMADITTPTNRSVTVSATFSSDSVTKQYSTDNMTWKSYTTGVVMTANGTVYFRAADEIGNVSDVTSYDVTNIDRVAPARPTASADITTATNRDVTVTATFSTDTAQKQYSIDNEAWKTYTTGVVMTDNGTIYFRGIDTAGNVSEVTPYIVTNIDKTPPAPPVVSVDVTAPTIWTVTLRPIFSDDSVLKLYSLDGQNYWLADSWLVDGNGFVMNENCTVYFRAIDAAGNVSDASYTVTNIDRDPPAPPTVSADVTGWTNGNVTVSAVFSDDSVQKLYTLDGWYWTAYAQPVVMTDNGTVYFRGVDEAGNYSSVTSYTVGNIDKIAPSRPTASADFTMATNQNVIVTATFSSDSAVKEYSLDNKTWQAYTTGVVMTANGSVYFRAADAAGNVSDVTSYTVTNIDKVAPTKPTASADITAATNRNVTVTATFSTDSAVREYSLDNKAWQAYTAGVVMTANGSVYFRAADAAGNVSDVTSYAVTNITAGGTPVTPTGAPAKPTAKADITAATNKNVTVTATFSADSAQKQYSLDNKTWQAYTSGVVMAKNGTVYFRGINSTGKASDVASYAVTNIDKVAPTKPTAKANVTTSTTGSVTVTATFSSDSAQKQYSTDNKTWKAYTTGVVMSKNGTVHFRGIDAAGNVSQVTDYVVSNITTSATVLPYHVEEDVHLSPGEEKVFTPKLEASGRYTFIESSYNMTVTFLDQNNKKIAKGKSSIVKDLLLDSSMSYRIVVKNTSKSDGYYTDVLYSKELFTKGDNSNDTLKGAKTLAAGTPANDWVGYGDAVDYYKLGVDARGGFYDLSIAGVRNNVKLTIFAADGRKVKGVTVSAKKPAVALANLCLANGSYAVVEAPKAAKAQNSEYKLQLTQKAVFTGAKNNDWAQAEVLAKGATFTGALTKAAGGDTVDYCDVSKIDALTFDMTEGKTKVSFYDAQHNAVKTTVKLANGADKTAASLTLAAGNAATDNFTISAIDDAVKYLKIEASGKTLNGYTITKIA